MHDLFTRGVTPDGKLRPTRAEAPQLYKESPLGWIPKEWEVQPLDNCSAKVCIVQRNRCWLERDCIHDELVDHCCCGPQQFDQTLTTDGSVTTGCSSELEQQGQRTSIRKVMYS